MNDRNHSMSVTSPAHLRLRGGEGKLAATDAAARFIIDEAAEERARKTARLQALRLAKADDDREALSQKAASIIDKRAARK